LQYDAPVTEFVVDAIQIEEENLKPLFEYKLIAKECKSILIVIHCEGSFLQKGGTFFFGFSGFFSAQINLTVGAIKSSLLMYREYCRLE